MKYFVACAGLLLLLPGVRAQEWTYETAVEARVRYEDRDNRDFVSLADDARQDTLYRLRLDIAARAPDTGFLVFFQPQLSTDDYSVPNRDDTYNRGSIHQLYAQWRPPEQPALLARAGRQEMAYGNQRLIGAFGWDNVGRSFDGLRADYSFGRHTLSAFGVRLGDASVRAQTPKLYGLYDSIKVRKTHTVDVYALYKHDSVRGTEQDVYTFGTRSESTRAGRWGYIAEGAVQTGDVGNRDLSAWAYSVNLGYTLPGPLTPRAAVEVNGASGGNPDDPDDVNTFDQLFPTNHDKYGIIDYQGWRNMRNVRVGLSARLPRAVTAGIDYHWFWLQDAEDFWYGAGGAPNRGPGGQPLRDPTGEAGRDVGEEFDVSATWPVRDAWSVSAGYAHFMPGSFVREVLGDADASDWWYVQASWKP